MLIKDEKITEKQLFSALSFQASENPEKRLGEILVDLKLLSQGLIKKYLKKQSDMYSKRLLFI